MEENHSCGDGSLFDLKNIIFLITLFLIRGSYLNSFRHLREGDIKSSSVCRALIVFSSVQFSSGTQPCLTFCYPMDCSTPGFPVHHNSWSLTKLVSIESVIPSNHLILCCPLLLPSIFPNIRVFSNEAVLCIK